MRMKLHLSDRLRLVLYVRIRHHPTGPSNLRRRQIEVKLSSSADYLRLPEQTPSSGGRVGQQ